MAYFYVKNSLGTRTSGGGLTKQTGSFTALGASNVYANITAAITDGATSGDFICVSDAHSYSLFSGIAYVGPTSGDFLYIVSVDDANCDAEKTATAAQEHMTDAFSEFITTSGRLSLHGLWLKTTDDGMRLLAANSQVFAKNLTFENVTASKSSMLITSDGTYFHGVNCTFTGNSGQYIRVAGGSKLTLINCTMSDHSKLIEGTAQNGGAVIDVIGCDLSDVSSYLVEAMGNAANTDDGISVTISGCQLNASLTGYVEETLENLNHRITVTNCSGTSAAAEYQFYQAGYGGAAEEQDDTGIHRDENIAFPSGTKISLKCVTDTNATPAAPFWFDFPTRYAELSNTATDTLTVYLASTATLYDSDVWVELIYPDGTNEHIPNYISTRHTDVMDTNGTALTTDSGSTWKNGASDLTAYNEYKIDVDTSSDAGADCVPIIRVYVSKASTTVYFCPTVELS